MQAGIAPQKVFLSRYIHKPCAILFCLDCNCYKFSNIAFQASSAGLLEGVVKTQQHFLGEAPMLHFLNSFARMLLLDLSCIKKKKSRIKGLSAVQHFLFLGPCFTGLGTAERQEENRVTIQYSIKTRDYDSEFGSKADGENATSLTVILKLLFNQVESASGFAKDSTNRRFRVLPWTEVAFEEYLRTFKKTSEEAWSDKIYILFPDPRNAAEAMNASDYRALQNPALIGKKPPFLKCRLSIQFTLKNPHAELYVLNLAPGQDHFQSHVFRKPGMKDVGVLSNEAVKLIRQSGADELFHRPAAHEVGHLLGLGHPNEALKRCQANPNAEICYGGTPYEKRSIMGMGMAVSGEHAKAWLSAIRKHTAHQHGWKSTHISPPLEALLKF
jgi:hypothetical protein